MDSLKLGAHDVPIRWPAPSVLWDLIAKDYQEVGGDPLAAAGLSLGTVLPDVPARTDFADLKQWGRAVADHVAAAHGLRVRQILKAGATVAEAVNAEFLADAAEVQATADFSEAPGAAST